MPSLLQADDLGDEVAGFVCQAVASHPLSEISLMDRTAIGGEWYPCRGAVFDLGDEFVVDGQASVACECVAGEADGHAMEEEEVFVRRLVSRQTSTRIPAEEEGEIYQRSSSIFF